MAVAQEQILIDRSVGEVWGIHTRPETILHISVNTKRYEPDRPMGRGCRIAGATKVVGKTVEWVAIVSEFAELNRYKLESVQAPVQWTLEYRYEPVGGATRVTAEQQALGLSGFFGSISEAFLVRRYRRDLRRNLQNLKTLIEGGAL